MKQLSTFIALLLISLLYFGCQSPTDSSSDPVTLTGVVLDAGNGGPVANAIVRKFAPPPEVFTVTDEEGNFLLEIDADTSYTASIEIIKEGYITETLELFIVPERNIELPVVNMRVPGSQGEDDDDDDDIVTPGESGPPSTIVLAEASHEFISVRETGANDQAVFTFSVTDAQGRPINMENQTEVRFGFGGRPDGGEFLSPETELTDEIGRVSTILTSGTVSGVTQVIAEFTRDDGVVVKSKPVNMAIHSGLPDLDHFTVASQVLNMPGNIMNVQNPITALVGDKYGNMVQPGTSVYFTTSGGLIQGSSSTNDMGSATVTLVTGNPFPEHPQLGPGFATVRARTANELDQTIETTTLVLFSLFPTISVTPDFVDVDNGGSQSFTYTVADIHGNPMVAGTTISVEVEGDNLDVIGDVDITMPDTQARGQGTTEFQFTLSDADPEEEELKPVQITISVTGANGTAKRTITGTTKRPF